MFCEIPCYSIWIWVSAVLSQGLWKNERKEQTQTSSKVFLLWKWVWGEGVSFTEHGNCMWQTSVMTVAPSQTTISSEYTCFAGLELPVVHMKKKSKKSPGVYKKKPSQNGTGTVDTGHSHEDSSLPLLTKSMS